MKQEVKSNASELHKTVFHLTKECFPKDKVNQEELIKIDGKQLFIDIYIPRLKIAIECDGIQHDQYTKFFHGDATKFKEQKINDELKNRYCEIEDICLIRIKYNEEISKRILSEKITAALKGEK